ncbi:arrestin domain-containing protein 3-like [Babylonia areolata]|uniref:arrestin domain-containing protein 3-like n=1 Tax=Babylonia areolata TaxID=304850 RepID=UPI003FD21E0D
MMGRPKVFQINLNSPNGVYYGGQTLSGTVTMELEEALTMRALRLEFKGQATVHWTEQRSNGKTSYTVVYHNEEHYFNAKQELWHKDKDGRGTDEMARGLYNYPFQFTLPSGLPCSYEGGIGHVRYTVKAVIDRKFRFDYNTKRPFTVINDLDLNNEPEALMEMTNTHHKFLCCCCCKSGPITGTVRIARRGYVPGEAILVDGDIENLSRRRMTKTTMRIYQQIDFHAQTKTRRERRVVAELQHGEIKPGGGDTWNAERLAVPPLPPSVLRGCRIIDIHYFLQLNVDPAGIGFDLKVPVSIIIGTIPLKQALDQYSSMALRQPPPGMPSRDDIYSSTAAAAMEPHRPPPPTYSESVFGKMAIKEGDEDKEDEADNSFAPSYTYYNWGFQSSSTGLF